MPIYVFNEKIYLSLILIYLIFIFPYLLHFEEQK